MGWRSLSLAGAVSIGTISVGVALADEQPLGDFVAPPLASHLSELTAEWIDLNGQDDVDLGEYWIGVHLGEVPQIAKSQLKLDHGLTTIAVMPDGPARKAGIEPHDILLRVGDKKLSEPMELVRAVNDAKDQKIALTLLRGGKEQTLEVQPEKRPQPETGEEPVARVMALTDGQGSHELAQLERALRDLQVAGPQEGGVGLWFVRPPIWASTDARVTVKVAELPEDVHLTIQKKGREPAHVIVKRGDKSWEATEGKLDELPEDVREPVARLLGKTPLTVHAQVLHGKQDHYQPHPGQTQVERRVVVVGPHGDAEHNQGTAAKLDLILKKLDRLGGASSEQVEGRAVESGAEVERLNDLQREVQRLRKEVDSRKKSNKRP